MEDGLTQRHDGEVAEVGARRTEWGHRRHEAKGVVGGQVARVPERKKNKGMNPKLYMSYTVCVIQCAFYSVSYGVRCSGVSGVSGVSGLSVTRCSITFLSVGVR